MIYSIINIGNTCFLPPGKKIPRQAFHRQVQTEVPERFRQKMGRLAFFHLTVLVRNFAGAGKKEDTMKKQSLFKQFLTYVSLNICGMIGLSCYILADTFFVSNGLGTSGLTALNLAIPVYSIVHGCGLMLGMGGATKYSIFRGQADSENANRTFSAVLFFTSVLAFLFVLAGLFLSRPLTVLLGADNNVFSMTLTYLTVILLFAPAFMLNDVFICFVRNDGNPALSMAAMLTGSFSNIILDYIFIFPLNMGILGAVLATGIAPLISMSILSVHGIRKKHHFHWIRHRISVRLMANILSLGIPSLVTEIASAIVMIAFNSILLSLCGNTGVAAYGVIANLSLVVTSIYTGIAQGTQPITSRAYGRGDRNTMKRALQYAVCCSLAISALIYLLFFFGAEAITSVLNSERDISLQYIAVSGLKIYFTAIPFAGFNIILSTYFTTIEKTLPAQVISLARALFVILPAVFLLSSAFGVTGVWLSYPVTEAVVCLAGVWLQQKGI